MCVIKRVIWKCVDGGNLAIPTKIDEAD